MKHQNDIKQDEIVTEVSDAFSQSTKPVDETWAGFVCPNCGARLEGRKCKLLCVRPGCGYLVTCSEW